MGIPISNVPRRVVYAASGTGPYNFTFEILAATDIAVYKDDALLTLTTDYTLPAGAKRALIFTLTEEAAQQTLDAFRAAKDTPQYLKDRLDEPAPYRRSLNLIPSL